MPMRLSARCLCDSCSDPTSGQMDRLKRVWDKIREWTFAPQPNLLTKAAAEFTGCLLFHFIGSSSPTPFVNASALVVMVYYTAKLSGGHLNPALTTTFSLLGYTNPVEVLVYWASQLSGSIVGALLVAALSSNLSVRGPVGSSDNSGCFAPNPTISGLQVMGWEAICTFGFILPIFSVVWYTQSKNGYGNTGPIIVGLSLYAAASAASQWTGGALNPARALASSVVFDCDTAHLWYYVAGEFIGAAAVPLAVFPWYGVAADDSGSTDSCYDIDRVMVGSDYDGHSQVSVLIGRGTEAPSVRNSVEIPPQPMQQRYVCKPVVRRPPRRPVTDDATNQSQPSTPTGLRCSYPDNNCPEDSPRSNLACRIITES